MKRVTEVVHDWLRETICPGDLVVDATAGNGHDTRLLAELAGSRGTVLAFDIQEEALEVTRRRLARENLLSQTQLIHASHAGLAAYLPAHQPLRAVTFNLGFLPGSGKSVITRPSTTLAGLTQALRHLDAGGLITVVCYPGHDGGKQEAEAVVSLCQSLDSRQFRCLRCDPVNSVAAAPFALGISKRDRH